MNIEQVNMIREGYKELALAEEEPNREIRTIWNTSVDVMACYLLFKQKPIRNIKYGIRMIKKKRLLERLIIEKQSKVTSYEII